MPKLTVQDFLEKIKKETVNESDYRTIEKILDNKIGDSQKTIIHFLAENGYLDAIIRLTLAAKSYGLFDAIDANGNTPLHLACAKGHYSVVEYLIDYTKDLIIENKDKMQPLMYLEKLRDEFFEKMGINENLVATCSKDIAVNRAVLNQNTFSLDVDSSLQFKAEQIKHNHEFVAKFGECHLAVERLTNSINWQHQDSNFIAKIDDAGRTILTPINANVNVKKFTPFFFSPDSATAYMGTAEKTASLILWESFIEDVNSFISRLVLKEKPKECSFLNSLSEISFKGNWLQDTIGKINALEKRIKKSKLNYDKSFITFIQDRKSKLEKHLQESSAAKLDAPQIAKKLNR